MESLGFGMGYIMQKYGRDNFIFLDNFIRMTIPYITKDREGQAVEAAQVAPQVRPYVKVQVASSTAQVTAQVESGEKHQNSQISAMTIRMLSK